MGTAGEPVPAEPAPDDTGHRRAFIRRAGLAAVAGAVAAMGRDTTAGAANSGNLLIGQTNTGSNVTRLQGGSSLAVADGRQIGVGDDPASVIGTTRLTGGTGVLGQADGPQGVGVIGVANGDGAPAAVYGLSQASGGTGVHGHDLNATTPGVGVRGVSAKGTGVSGAGPVFDLEAAQSGRIALTASGMSAPPAGASVIGTLARDDAGNLWFCAASGEPGTWRKLAGPSAAGAFHAIDPVRVYDSRLTGDGPVAPRTSRIVGVKDARGPAGDVVASDAVPPGATAISYNLTVTAPTGPNVLAVTPGDASAATTSAINFNGTADVANAAIVKIDAERRITVWGGDQSGSCHVVVDVTGYYL